MDQRKDILRNTRVILMTPDVVHAWLMSNLRERQIHDSWNASGWSS